MRMLGWTALVAVVIAGAWYWYSHGAPAAPQTQTTGIASTTALANPASVNCVNLGGTLEIKDTAQGQVGICHLSDGRACEEWGLFRGEGCTDPTATSTQDGSVSQNLALSISSNGVLGRYLVGYTGMTLYTYAGDKGTASSCTGQCAVNWPPYVVPAQSVLNFGAGVNGTVSTTVRADGSTQVTYNGHPLYFYLGDKTASDTKGEGVGGVWRVARP